MATEASSTDRSGRIPRQYVRHAAAKGLASLPVQGIAEAMAHCGRNPIDPLAPKKIPNL
jgi:hypothetical protein